jgi:hypothetical protein
MKVASITETATIHGFTEGRHSMGAAAVFGDVVLTI